MAEKSGVERFGVEAIPEELRTVGWRDLFSILFSFHLNPIMYLLGALAVTAGGLPLWWAVGAITLGQALCWLTLIPIARAGADDGLPGQVAMRGTFGVLGARLLTSPYRMIAATYWFAAQALAAGLGIQALSEGLTGRTPPLVAVAVGVGVVQALLAVAGFDTFRFVVRVMLGNVATPLAGVILADVCLLKRSRLDVPELFESRGLYSYVSGFNPAALAAVLIGVIVYYLLPADFLKAAWGVGVRALVYLALARVELALWPRLRAPLAPASG